MATNEDIEIYRQRYETFRYLDGLHWQMFKIAIIILGPFSVAYVRTSPNIAQWILMVIGILFIIFGVTMFRIGQGVNMNNKVLHRVASRIGDKDIPLTSNRWLSVRFWASLILTLSGVLSVAAPVLCKFWR